MGPGYDIGASLANSSASGANPFEEAGTVFNFASPGAENDLAGTANPSTTSSATATTALPGGVAESSSATGTASPIGTASTASGSSGLSLGTILIFAAAGLIGLHFLKK